MWTIFETRSATVIASFSFPFYFLSFVCVSSLCFLIISRKNNKSCMECTFLGNSSDILVICYASAHFRLITFVPGLF